MSSKMSLDHFLAVRRDLHQHPELSFQEYRTAQRVADELTQFGYEVHTNIGGTGVVGVLRRGNSQRSIGLRADMDALPLQENNRFGHASIYPGKMHACGHDGHVAMLLAGAYAISQLPEHAFSGVVHCIFQPAEEGGGGAKHMIEDGLFEKFPCDRVFALHNWPGLPTGQFATRSGAIMASSNEFVITIHGKGCHAAMPHTGQDVVYVAAQLVTQLYAIIDRHLHPVDAAVLTVTQIHTGTATNISPDTAKIVGTVRTFSNDNIDKIESRMRQIAAGISQAYDLIIDVNFQRSYPPTINNADVTHEVLGVMRSLNLPHAVLEDVTPTMGAEDFSFMLNARPGNYAFIGNGLGDHRLPDHGVGPCVLHNPNYDFNDELIAIGAQYWVAVTTHFLAPER